MVNSEDFCIAVMASADQSPNSRRNRGANVRFSIPLLIFVWYMNSKLPQGPEQDRAYAAKIDRAPG